MAKSKNLIRNYGYQYCEDHNQHYKQYCCGCALGLSPVERVNKKFKSDACRSEKCSEGDSCDECDSVKQCLSDGTA